MARGLANALVLAYWLAAAAPASAEPPPTNEAAEDVPSPLPPPEVTLPWPGAEEDGIRVTSTRGTQRRELLAKRLLANARVIHRKNLQGAREDCLDAMRLLPREHPLHAEARALHLELTGEPAPDLEGQPLRVEGAEWTWAPRYFEATDGVRLEGAARKLGWARALRPHSIRAAALVAREAHAQAPEGHALRAEARALMDELGPDLPDTTSARAEHLLMGAAAFADALGAQASDPADALRRTREALMFLQVDEPLRQAALELLVELRGGR